MINHRSVVVTERNWNNSVNVPLPTPVKSNDKVLIDEKRIRPAVSIEVATRGIQAVEKPELGMYWSTKL